MRLRPKTVQIKTAREINIARSQPSPDSPLVAVGPIIRAGIPAEEINEFVHQDTLKRGCRPAPLNYLGFPKTCARPSTRSFAIEIPGPQTLVDGDIINVDVTHLEGYHGDTSATFYVGTPSEDAKKVTDPQKVPPLGIAEVKPGARLGSGPRFKSSRSSVASWSRTSSAIGRKVREEPKVLRVGTRGGIRLKPGMTFTIEPMIDLGVPDVEVLEDE